MGNVVKSPQSACNQLMDVQKEQVKGPYSAISKVQDVGDCQTNPLFSSNKLQENEKGEVGKHRPVVLKVGPQWDPAANRTQVITALVGGWLDTAQV